MSGSTTARYVWSPVYVDAMVLRDRATATPGTLDERVWVQQDANFNVTAITDGSGAVLERYDYDPYGVRTVLTPSFGSRSASSYDFRHGFQGMVYDDVAGLNPQRMRWYSPTLGRWTTTDPMSYHGSQRNLYGMVENNPLRWADPLGLFSIEIRTAAFIHKKLGQWIENPGAWFTGVRTWFNGNERDFGEDITNSKMYSVITIDSDQIGKINGPIESNTQSSATKLRVEYTNMWAKVLDKLKDDYDDNAYWDCNDLGAGIVYVKTEKPTASATAKSSGDDTTISLKASGANPFFNDGVLGLSAAPAIDYNATINLSICNNKVEIWGWMSHNPFPSYELYVVADAINPEKDNYRYQTNDDGPGFLNLGLKNVNAKFGKWIV